jgi:hypothetical protein
MRPADNGDADRCRLLRPTDWSRSGFAQIFERIELREERGCTQASKKRLKSYGQHIRDGKARYMRANNYSITRGWMRSGSATAISGDRN